VTSLPTSNGVPYLPDGQGLGGPERRPWPAWLRAVIFATCYLALQFLYAQSIGTVVERFFLETAGSRPAAALIDLAQPGIQARAVGTRVTAPGGGINIGNGCEGTDLYFLLLAAFAAVALPWHRRLAGFGLGLALAFALNQARIVALFHAYRTDPSLFNLLHTTVAPVLLVIALVLYFHAWLRHCRSARTPAA
jgi:exosortase/archaeosortase family protein